MQHLLCLALVPLSVAALACNPITLSGGDAGQDGDRFDSGTSGGGECDPACGENATCNSDDTCECNAGFAGDGQDCVDVDECEADNGGCDSNALCINTAGDRLCVCNANFAGDGETCTQVWSLLGTLPNVDIDPEGHGAIAAAAGQRVFFGPITNGTPFMRSFDISSAQFLGPHALPPGNQTDFCGCGLTQSFVSDGSRLYLLGNDGQVYQPNTDSWSTFTQYSADSRRGEAGSSYDAVSNAIVLFGGRNNETNAIRFDLSSTLQSGIVESGAIPVPMDSAVAHGVPNMALSLVAHRNPQSDIVELFAHPTGTGEWIAKADAPAGMGRPVAMGHRGEEIWVADGNGALFFFDLNTETWNGTPLDAPPGTEVVLNAAQGATIAIAQEGADVRVYRLNPLP